MKRIYFWGEGRQEMEKGERSRFPIFGVVVILILVALVWFTISSVREATQSAIAPVQQANAELRTQVAQFLHPTPTILPDPVTVIREVHSLARLETIQYSVEKVITAETGQNELAALFGDKLIFVAHGTVIAGVDLQKITEQDLTMQGNTLLARLPDPEVFVATLDNDKSYVYDRQTGLFTKGDTNLEKTARQAAEDEIRKAALVDGILDQARQNAETFLGGFLRSLGYKDVVFIKQGQ